jgi:SAM-dependent methyltransferase
MTPSPIDDAHMRAHKAFRLGCLDDPRIKGRVLEIGPDPKHRKGAADWQTLDVLPGCTYKADICDFRDLTGLMSVFDTILCMEVLEHTIWPTTAVDNMAMLLKPGGTLIGSTPLNARIHGPLPDCWRFTVHGLRVLLKDFDDVKIEPLESDRPLFPVGYRWSGVCNKTANRDPRLFTWERE